MDCYTSTRENRRKRSVCVQNKYTQACENKKIQDEAVLVNTSTDTSESKRERVRQRQRGRSTPALSVMETVMIALDWTIGTFCLYICLSLFYLVLEIWASTRDFSTWALRVLFGNGFFKRHTVNSEIFARILFSRIALKGIFATFKIRDLDMIYLHKYTTEWFRESFIFAKLRIREVSW